MPQMFCFTRQKEKFLRQRINKKVILKIETSKTITDKYFYHNNHTVYIHHTMAINLNILKVINRQKLRWSISKIWKKKKKKKEKIKQINPTLLATISKLFHLLSYASVANVVCFLLTHCESMYSFLLLLLLKCIYTEKSVTYIIILNR